MPYSSLRLYASVSSGFVKENKMPEQWIIRDANVVKNLNKRIEELLIHPGKYGLELFERKKKRTLSQNAVSHVWYGHIEKRLDGYDALSAKCESKLYCGVPMLLADEEHFREQWEKLIKDRFTLEEKLELMEWFPVTSLMSVKQLSRYLERMQAYWRKAGVNLEFPSDYEHYPEAAA
jgi:hypothetical protein